MTPQCEMMLNHLIVNGSITGMQAIEMGIMNYKAACTICGKPVGRSAQR